MPAPNRLKAFEALLAGAEGDPLALVHLARLFQSEGDAARALALCRQAHELAPDDEEVHAYITDTLGSSVPDWHFTIVRDARRNRAYAEALARAITPGCRVLEIGAGTGLLALLAARAGADQVITCEANPTAAGLAEQIVAGNGYADRVRVIAKHSTQLDPDKDLGGRADLLVSEIFSNNLLGEGALPAIEDAWRRLLKPEARVIPQRGRILVALAEDSRYAASVIGAIDGFDLSAFNLARRPKYQVRSGAARLELRSNSAVLFSFDFQGGRHFPAEHRSITVSGCGRVNGIVQWIALDLDDTSTYENRPGSRTDSCWAPFFHPLRMPMALASPETVEIRSRHDRQGFFLWRA